MSQTTLAEILWQKAIENNNFEQAEKIYQHLAKTSSLNEEYCSVMGLWYEQRQDYAKAIAAFKEALRFDSAMDDELYYQIALCYFETAQFAEAEQYLSKSLLKDPQFADAIYLYAETLAHLGKNGQAAAHYKYLLKLIPDDIQLCINVAASISQLGYQEEAIEIYHRALVLDSDNYYLFSNLGVEYAELGDYDDALFCHYRAISLNNFCADLWYNLACTYAHLKDEEKALDALEKSINLDSGNKEYAVYDEELNILHSSGRFWKLVE